MSVAKLDYDKTEIKMHCTSKIEATKRLVACAKEPETVAWIESLPYQSTLIDIGSNVGSYSLLAASLGHWVLSFEPVKANFQRLLQNIQLNEEFGDRIFACDKPLWWRREKVYMKLSSSQVGAAEHALHVGAGDDAYPLDDVLTDLPEPTDLKLDTDGNEMPILLGAERTLKSIRSIQIELDDNLRDSRIIPEWLFHRGFELVHSTRHGQTSISNALFRRV